MVRDGLGDRACYKKETHQQDKEGDEEENPKHKRLQEDDAKENPEHDACCSR